MKMRSIVVLLAMLVLLAGCAPKQEPPGGVADAAMYRRTVMSIAVKNDNLVLTLKQEPGTDFGRTEIIAELTADTSYEGDANALAPWDYVEIYYGADGTGTPETVTIISLKKLPEASHCLYNGRVVDLQMKGGVGSIRLAEIGGDEAFDFSIDETTQLYLDVGALKLDDELNVFYLGPVKETYPPQAVATEIRPYAEP